MKILYIAFACSPVRGSECLLGWEWSSLMSRYHEVYVITRCEFKEEIEQYMKEHAIRNIHIFYFDISQAMKKIVTKIWVVYFKTWLKQCTPYIRKLNDTYHFDIIHQVTLSEFRTISDAWKMDARFFYGPSGGAQITPEYLLDYTKGHSFEEKIRAVINANVVKSKKYKKAVTKCEEIFCTNQETKSVFDAILGKNGKTHMLLDVGIEQEVLETRRNIKKEHHTKVTFLWAGRMVYRKGLELLLDSLALIPKDYEYEVILCGNGPQLEELKSKVEMYGLQKKVCFAGLVSYTEMENYYLQADAFVFPSLRESTGTVILEAMSFHLPVIGFQAGGAREIFTPENSFSIEGNNILDIKTNLAHIIEDCVEHSDKLKKMGECAFRTVEDNFTWNQKISTMNEFYMRK